MALIYGVRWTQEAVVLSIQERIVRGVRMLAAAILADASTNERIVVVATTKMDANRAPAVPACSAICEVSIGANQAFKD